MKKTFTFHTDPGHGWLEVSVFAAHSIGLNPSDFSPYSYRKGNTLYLEEDCDAPKLLNRVKELGLPFKLIERNDNDESFVRSLPHIYG